MVFKLCFQKWGAHCRCWVPSWSSLKGWGVRLGRTKTRIFPTTRAQVMAYKCTSIPPFRPGIIKHSNVASSLVLLVKMVRSTITTKKTKPDVIGLPFHTPAVPTPFLSPAEAPAESLAPYVGPALGSSELFVSAIAPILNAECLSEPAPDMLTHSHVHLHVHIRSQFQPDTTKSVFGQRIILCFHLQLQKQRC